MVWNSLLLAVRAIRRNVLRSFLTILGIVIGVSAVIVMMTLGDGATQHVPASHAAYDGVGSNRIPSSVAPRKRKPLSCTPANDEPISSTLPRRTSSPNTDPMKPT